VKQSILLIICLFVLGSLQAAESATSVANSGGEQTDWFAKVDNQIISAAEFNAAYQAGIRKRFYHGKIPEKQLKDFREEVSRTLIQRVLLVAEARRRGLQPDAAVVQEQLDAYEERYSKQSHWAQYRDQIMSGLKSAIEEENLLTQLEHQIKNIDAPAEAVIRKFYQANPAFFTTPEKLKLSVILLKVLPSSGADVWQAAHEEAEGLVKRLRKGADFGELARIHSGDKTAAQSGDMGYVHKGMLAPPAQKAIDTITDGEITEPVMLLSGVAIFKLEHRAKAELNEFEKVKQRATQLYLRETKKTAWEQFKQQLRTNAKVSINSALL
jgi:peptidyl-prolyl cis-trans isomerase C